MNEYLVVNYTDYDQPGDEMPMQIVGLRGLLKELEKVHKDRLYCIAVYEIREQCFLDYTLPRPQEENKENPENIRIAHSVGTAYSADCNICNDPYYTRKGPVCRKCPDCGGHIAANDSVCDSCEYNEYEHYGEG